MKQKDFKAELLLSKTEENLEASKQVKLSQITNSSNDTLSEQKELEEKTYLLHDFKDVENGIRKNGNEIENPLKVTNRIIEEKDNDEAIQKSEDEFDRNAEECNDEETSYNQDEIVEDDEEDDTELLLLELEKIKRERMEEKKRLAEAEDSIVMNSNPLRFQNQQKSSMALTSWTQDTVFRNQVTTDNKPKKRFINDMGRSDFHKKFMEKYIR